MTSFFIFIIIGFIFFLAWNRFARIESRVTLLEKQQLSQLNSSPREIVSPEVLKKEGIHEGDFFMRAEEAGTLTELKVSPAPAPMPMQTNASSQETASMQSSSRQSQEETGAKWLGRVGGFAVFLGVAYFLKYAFDNNIIGETGRVILGIIFGIGFIGVGQKLRSKYLNYSDMLNACGIGILYLSLYASYGFYHILGASLVFVFMTLITVFGMLIALSGNSRGLAIFSLTGGFLTPLLLSTGENHLITLSLYLIMLDFGAFGVAWFKKWTQLNYVSFFGTVVLFGGWFGSYYSSEQLFSAFSFASIFFVIFLVTSVLHHLLRSEPTSKGDLALLVVNAMWYFGFCYRILESAHHDVLGFFALLLSVLYLSVAYVAYQSNHSDRTLNLFLPGISVVFLSVAIPLQLTSNWVALAWIVEAVVLVATGLFLRERVIVLFGWIVLFLGFSAIGKVIGDLHTTIHSPFANVGFFLMMCFIFALYVIAWLYSRWDVNEKEGSDSKLPALVLASLVTVFAFTNELSVEYPHFVSIPWLVEGGIVLSIGLFAQSRKTEILAWVFVVLGMLTAFRHVGEIQGGFSGLLSQTPYNPLPFLNLGTFLVILSVITCCSFIVLYRRVGAHVGNQKKLIGVILITANLITIGFVSSEISYRYDREIREIYNTASRQTLNDVSYYGSVRVGSSEFNTSQSQEAYSKASNLKSKKENAISIFWLFYSTILVVLGFVKRLRNIRLFGLVFFFVTAGRVFLQILASADELGRIFTIIVFGLIALGASFLYVKFKDRIIHE